MSDTQILPDGHQYHEIATNGYVDISPELLVHVLKGLTGGSRPRRFTVTTDAIPEFATVSRFDVTPDGQFVRVWLEGTEARQYSPQLTTVFDGDAE